MLLCLQIVGDTTQAGDRAGPGMHCSSPSHGGAGPPKCQAAPEPCPDRFDPLVSV